MCVSKFLSKFLSCGCREWHLEIKNVLQPTLSSAPSCADQAGCPKQGEGTRSRDVEEAHNALAVYTVADVLG